MNKVTKVLAVCGVVLGLSGCSGQEAEIPTGYVGKIQTQNGFSDDVRNPSKFRLDACFKYCDRLVTLDVSDKNYQEVFKTLMPKDDLVLTYGITMTMAVDPKKYNFIFGNVPFDLTQEGAVITQKDVYNRYAQPQLQTIIPSILTEFTIGEVASEREKVNAYIKQRLNKELSSTPFILKHVGLKQVILPSIITEAKERAATRREEEEQVKAERTLELLKIETEKEVETSRREVELMKAKVKADIAKKLMTPAYETLLKYETLQMMATSSNKVIVPVAMLDGLAVQQEIK